MSVMLGRVTWFYLCTVNLIGHRVLIFCAKTCSIFLPNMNTVELHILTGETGEELPPWSPKLSRRAE